MYYKVVVAFLFLTWSLLISFSQAGEILIEVKDDDGKGVSSCIYIDNSSQFKGDTDSDGIYTLRDGCKPNQWVIAKPKIMLYDEGKNKWDGKNKVIEVRVTKKNMYHRLANNRSILEQKGNYGAVALISNELAARIVDSEVSQKETETAIKAFAKHLKLSSMEPPLVYDSHQGKKVATESMVKAVRQFQKTNGLKQSGVVDYMTLEKAAGTKIGVFMYQDIAE